MRKHLFLFMACLVAVFFFCSEPVIAELSSQPSADSPTLQEMEEALKRIEVAYKSDPKNDLLREQLVRAYHAMSARLVKENNLNDALHYLEWAEDLEQQGSRPARQDGGAYIHVGLAALDRGNLYQAKEHFDRALAGNSDPKLKRTIAVALHNKGVEAANRNQLSEARKYLEMSIFYFDQIQNTLEFLGDIAYQTQDLVSAKKYWERAQKVEATLQVKQKLEKLGREAKVELDMTHYGASHFIIRYKREDKAYEGYELKQLLEEAYRKVSADFNHYPDLKVPVILYDQAEFEQVVNSPHWSAGVYDGKIRLPAYEEGKADVRELKRVIYHELTHAFVSDIAQDRCPVWLNEGLAQYVEDKVVPVDTGQLLSSLKQGQRFIFKQIASGVPNSNDTSDAALFYQQSFSMTKFLIDQYRVYRIKEILQLLNTGTTFEEALHKTTGLSIDQFERKWIASLT